MKASEVCDLLNEAVAGGANIEALMAINVAAPAPFLAASHIEGFQDLTGNGWFGVLGLINAIIDDRDTARIYIMREGNDKPVFRFSVKS